MNQGGPVPGRISRLIYYPFRQIFIETALLLILYQPRPIDHAVIVVLSIRHSDCHCAKSV